MMNKRTFLIAVATALPATAFLSQSAVAAEPLVYATGDIAINGYDLVVYFTEGKPVKGVARLSSQWEGAMVHFPNAAHKEMFDADPEALAPKYGGYCSYAVSKGYTPSTDSAAWTIHEVRLYLNYSRSVWTLWNLKRDDHIVSADANWPRLLEG